MGTAPIKALGNGHIFLSHAGADTQAARQLAEILRRSGLEVWFDQDDLKPGDPWMPTLEQAILHASAMIVYIGRLGIQDWVDREVRFGLVRNTQNREAFRFIPVLGEGADPTKLPPFVQQQQFVDLRDAQRAPEQIRRLLEILRNSSSSPGAISPLYWTTHSPFRSMQVFGPEDSWLFFGRDRDTDELLTRLGRAPTLAVIGNSGSGKSSLIQAGLIPALRRGRFQYDGKLVRSWRIAVFRPSAAPFDYLAETLPGQLAPDLSPKDLEAFIDSCKKKFREGGEALRNAIAALVKPSDQNAHVLLVADQLEEIFTLVEDKATRNRYIDGLLAAARLDGAIPVHLVLGLRADFYSHCLNHPELSVSLDTNLYNVPLINPSHLQEAIENRVALAGAGTETGLIDSLLSDVGAEPGNLALLEHALSQLWEKSGGTGRTLTSAAYSEIGRLRGAIGRHANNVYLGLSEADQLLTKRIFLELVHLGEGAQDTRRRVAKQSLLHLGALDRVERVIAQLASKRLVTTSGYRSQSGEESFVEVSHEALIREWPTLQEWLKVNREDLRLGRLLEQAAEVWRNLEEDPSVLMRGIRLAQGLEWLSRHADASVLLEKFLKASRFAEEEAERKDREAQERETARRKELEYEARAVWMAQDRFKLEADRRRVAEKTAETVALSARLSEMRSISRLLYALSALLQLLLIAIGVAIFVWWRQLGALSHGFALGVLLLLVAGLAVFALFLFVIGRCYQLIAQAIEVAVKAKAAMRADHPKALALAIRGWQMARAVAIVPIHGKELATAYLAVADAFPQRLATLYHKDVVANASFSPDGRRIVTASLDKTARVWHAADGKLLTKLEGHTDRVWHASFSPDGQRIVTSSDDATARLWNAANGQLLAVLEGHTDKVWRASFSPDGHCIVTTGLDKTARIWSAANGGLVAELEGHTEPVRHASFSPDSQRIVTASDDHTARLWNSANGQQLAKLEGHSDVVGHTSFSPDGQRIVTASWDNTARVWNANGQLLAKLEGHTGTVWQAAFSPDSQRIVTASWDNTARVWHAANGQLLTKLVGHTDRVWHAAFSPDGLCIVTASLDNSALVSNAANGQLLARLVGDSGSVVYAAFSPDGLLIVTASNDAKAIVWNAVNSQLLADLGGHWEKMWPPSFSPDGLRVVTASSDNAALVWNANGQLLAKLESHTDGIRHAAFSPDGQRIVTVSQGKTAWVWNAAKGQLLATLEGHTDIVSHVAFSPDGQRIVTASQDKTARVWNAAKGQLLATLEGHTDCVVHAAFSPDGQRIVTASQDNTARVWHAAKGQLLATLEGHTDCVVHAAFSPDGQRIVTASQDNTARVWYAAKGQLLATLEGHTDGVVHAAFSPDGQRIVTACQDKTARLWHAAKGQVLATLEGHTDIVSHVAFSPDGQRIVTASQDRTARVWNAANGQLFAGLKGHTDGVVHAAFSLDGQRIFTASRDNTVRVYRMLTLSDLVELFGKQKIGRPRLRSILGASPRPEPVLETRT